MAERAFTENSRWCHIVTPQIIAPPLHGDNQMSSQSEKEIVRIDLTSEQKEQVKNATEKNAEAIELTVQELESRIAPRVVLQ
jgi:hypothetical protein